MTTSVCFFLCIYSRLWLVCRQFSILSSFINYPRYQHHTFITKLCKSSSLMCTQAHPPDILHSSAIIRSLPPLVFPSFQLTLCSPLNPQWWLLAWTLPLQGLRNWWEPTVIDVISSGREMDGVQFCLELNLLEESPMKCITSAWRGNQSASRAVGLVMH